MWISVLKLCISSHTMHLTSSLAIEEVENVTYFSNLWHRSPTYPQQSTIIEVISNFVKAFDYLCHTVRHILERNKQISQMFPSVCVCLILSHSAMFFYNLANYTESAHGQQWCLPTVQCKNQLLETILLMLIHPVWAIPASILSSVPMSKDNFNVHQNVCTHLLGAYTYHY